MKKKNKLSKVIKDKNSIIYSSIILFLLLSFLLKLIPNNISDFLMYFIFPLVFVIYTILHISSKKINWEFPLFLLLIYLASGYIVIPKLMTPLKVIIAYLSSLTTLIIYNIYCKNNKIKYPIEKKEETIEENKMFVSNSLPLLFVITLDLYFTIL